MRSPSTVRTSLLRLSLGVASVLLCVLVWTGDLNAQDPLRVFVSVDMEGIGGVGTSKMTNSGGGKDYTTARALMTAEVNAVVAAIYAHGPAEVLVNDSHGDMQNVLHTELDPRVEYIQGNIKPLGMVQGLDATFDAAIFIGYHARAGTEGGFLAHTGSGAVQGVWINGVEVGEGGMNAYFAGSHGVPVILAAGDAVFARQFGDLTGALTVSTKTAVGAQVARLRHPDVVLADLRAATGEALTTLDDAEPFVTQQPVTVRARFATTTRADILQAIPGMRRVDGKTVEIDSTSMDAAYRMIRLMYKYISW